MKFTNYHEIRSTMNSYKSLSGSEFNALLKEISKLSDEKKLDLFTLGESLFDNLSYVREAADSPAEIREWKRLCRRVNRIEQILCPAYDRYMEQECAKTKWDILREMDDDILVKYRDEILPTITSLTDDEKLEESIFINELLESKVVS